MAAQDPDELFTTRTLFWLGSFQGAINEATGNKRIPASLALEKQEYIYRSFLALGQTNVITSEINSNSSVGLRSIKVLAKYIDNPVGEKESAGAEFKAMLADSQDKTLLMMAASYYAHESNIKEAFKVIKNGANLEQHALLVQMYLRVDRSDLAQKQLKVMKALDEDSTLTMLCTAWVNMTLGQSKIQVTI